MSRLAVAALAAGGASCLVLVTPLAAMLPLVAIALSAAALREIRRSEGHMDGRWPALGGLALAVGFVSEAVATTVVEGMVAQQRATVTATAWMNAVREGRFDDALAVSTPGAFVAILQEQHGQAADESARPEAFRALPEVQSLAGCRERLPRQTAVERSSDGWVVRFSLEPCGGTGALTLAVAPRLVAVRGHAIEEWRVNGVSLER